MLLFLDSAVSMQQVATTVRALWGKKIRWAR
jgi:hypothetical protein